MSDEYGKGWQDGYDFALKHYDAHSGKMSEDYPDTFVHRQGSYNCGFGEGIISGRSKKIHDAFGKFKSIHWENGKAIVSR